MDPHRDPLPEGEGTCEAWVSCPRAAATTSPRPLVMAVEQQLCQVLNDAPIGAQGYVFAGECTGRRFRRTAAATSDFRTLGRISAEIRTLRLVGVKTGHGTSEPGQRRSRTRGGAQIRGPPHRESAGPGPRRVLACRLLSPVLSGEGRPATLDDRGQETLPWAALDI